MKRIAAASIGIVLAAAYACGGSSDRAPKASFANTTASGALFAQIREMWIDLAHVSRGEVRAYLEKFLRDFPNDGMAPVAHAYLAFLCMDQKDFACAAAELKALEHTPPGTTADLATTGRARWARTHGDPATAMKLLRPLVGKNVDPILKNLFQEELALTALASTEEHEKYEAIGYMDAWLQGTAEEEREPTKLKVAAIVAGIPREVLEASYRLMRARGESSGYGKDILHIVANRLAEIALRDGDVELARLLMDPTGGFALDIEGDAGAQLADLATSRRGLNVVEGRTIGLLLPTENPALRDESADALRGVMWSLGKPRGIRQILPATEDPKKKDAQPQGPALSPCALDAEAPDAKLAVDEPKDDDGIQLVTRDDSGSSDRTEAALDELVGQGASVIIAALDPDTAARVFTWSSRRDVPVIALTPPAPLPPDSKVHWNEYAFALGVSRAEVYASLLRAVPELGRGDVVPVVDASELPSLPSKGGEYGPFRILPPVSCDVPTPRAGEPRFPIAAWDKANARAWLVSGAPSCARDVVTELAPRAKAGSLVALTLEAAALTPPSSALRVVSAAAGIVPVVPASMLRDSELRRFVAAFGAQRLTWWTALGRDAATIARRVVMSLPTDSATSVDAVAKRRDTARASLAGVRVRLWTTEARGFDGKNAMARNLCSMDLGRAKEK